MKTISLWQPWASLAILGIKIYETRGWDTNYRGELGIHATKKVIPFDEAFEYEPLEVQEKIRNAICNAYGSYENLPTGAVLGTVELYNTIKTDDIRHKMERVELAVGDFSPGRYAWRLSNVNKFDKPIPAKGSQGFWNWTKP